MPIVIGGPGFLDSQEERIAKLVAMVGGPGKAAAVIGKSRQHIDNMRKPDAPLRLDDCLALSREAGVSLDWVATGYQTRPDIAAAGLGEGDGAFEGGLPGFTRLLPLRPATERQGQTTIEKWEPSEFAVSAMWLDGRGLTSERARYALLGDDGMKPLPGRGAFVVVDGHAAVELGAGVYVLDLEGEFVARRLIRLPGGKAELVADSEPSWRLPISAADRPELYRVVWWGQPA